MRKKGAEKGHVQFILIERVHFFLNRTRLLFSKLNMFTFSKSGHVHFFCVRIPLPEKWTCFIFWQVRVNYIMQIHNFFFHFAWVGEPTISCLSLRGFFGKRYRSAARLLSWSGCRLLYCFCCAGGQGIFEEEQFGSVGSISWSESERALLTWISGFQAGLLARRFSRLSRCRLRQFFDRQNQQHCRRAV